MVETRVPCPYCGEQILAEAKKCRFCGEWLSDDAPRVSPASTAIVAVEEFSDYKGPGLSTARTGAVLKREPWELRPDEQVITRSQPYVRRLLIVQWVVCVVLAIPTLGLALLVPIITWLVYKLKRFEWILTDRRLISVGGWLTRTAQNVSLEKINEVHYTRHLVDRLLLGTGTIAIESAATAGTTTLKYAADDDPFRRALEAQMETRRRALGRAS
jgi:hypothetical protein